MNIRGVLSNIKNCTVNVLINSRTTNSTSETLVRIFGCANESKIKEKFCLHIINTPCNNETRIV